MKLAVTVCATQKYAYALPSQARRVVTCCEDQEELVVILVGDNSQPLKDAEALYKELFNGRPGWTVERIGCDGLEDGLKNYKPAAQLLIAQMRTAAFTRARSLRVDQCWSLDSDVLPPANGLKCMQQMLAFDDGFYSISNCPYPSQGGGPFLGGRGTPTNHICKDWEEDEMVIPKKLKKQLAVKRKAFQMACKAKNEKLMDEVRNELIALDEELKKCPPKSDTFGLNSGGNWRRRGWIDHAYPALGKGSIVPSEWCGFGCTLMNKKALSLAHFDGYDGGGTEDLYIVWKRWFLSDLKINAILHCPADHVVRNPGKPGYFVHIQTYHEPEGECVGHLRQEHRPFNNFILGEKHDEKNDGKMVYPPPVESEKAPQVAAP